MRVNWLLVGWWLQAKGLWTALLASIVFLMDTPPRIVWLWIYGLCAGLYFGGRYLERHVTGGQGGKVKNSRQGYHD